MSNGRISDDVIEAVLKYHDIVDVVGKYVHLTKQGHYMKGLCPFHSEKTPSFTVTPEKQIYRCFGCGAGGSVINFMMEIESLTFVEAVGQLAEEAGISFAAHEVNEEQQEHQLERRVLLEAYDLAAKLYHYILKNTEQGKKGSSYLKARGFTDKLIDTFQIGYAPATWDTLAQFLEKRKFDMKLMEQGGLISLRNDGSGYFDKFRDRVIFPILDEKGRVIAFGGRAFEDVQPKYLNSPESILFRKSASLYNIHSARAPIRKLEQAVLFEGYVDVIKAWEAGVHNGIATLGTALTEEHAIRLRRNATKVIVCYDGDSAGQAAAFKSIPILEKAGCEVRIAMLPDAKDPDEFITEHGSNRFVREIIESAVPSMKYKLLYTRRHYRLQEEGDKLKYIQDSLKQIATLNTPTEREHYLKELSMDFGYTFDTLKQQLNELRMQQEKNIRPRDNNGNSWNNVMNNGGRKERTPSLFPAYHNAESKLLAVMMHDRDVAEQVQKELGEAFNVEAHAALAAYLYAYYAGGHEPQVNKYIATLKDESLERLASLIALSGNDQGINEKVIADYIREIKKYPQQRAIESKKEELIRAERSGDFLLAAQIGNEIIALEKLLKSF